jgi:hypothetical protein
VDSDIFSFRHAVEILEHRTEWHEIRAAVVGISRDDILREHETIKARRKKPPAGGQTAINSVFKKRMIDWTAEPRLFDSTDKALRGWKMDFLKNRIGVEVSFNHAEAVPWTFTRLNIAGESQDVMPEHRIDIGIAIFATKNLKSWAKMDDAVGTFELACEWLRLMKPIMPVPIAVVGLKAEGWTGGSFRGTRKRKSRTTSRRPAG